MALRQTAPFQLRLIACHVGGIIAEALAMPYLLAAGLEVRNVVLAGILGVVFFFTVAVVGGLAWRRSIMARPIQWAIAAPVGVAATIYVLVRALGGVEAADAYVAMEASFVGGICALFSSAFFLLWTWIAPVTPSSEQSRSR